MSADAASNEVEQVPDVHHPAGVGLIKPGYDPALTNEDLAPLKKQTWSSYNIFAFWMSDVHSVGGYLTAGSLFALGIAAWQVLVALLVGIVIVQIFVNLVAKPSQKTGVPYPVINRAIFGVKGANIPAIIRGLIAVAWYGVQTYLAAESLNIIFLKFIPSSAALLEPSFLGLPALGWISFAILWFAQAALFWTGMETIRKFIDWAGPAVYVVMVVLAIYLVSQAGWSNISFSLHSGEELGFWASIPVMLTAIAIVVSYFSGPMLNFGDFSRYGRSFEAVKKGIAPILFGLDKFTNLLADWTTYLAPAIDRVVPGSATSAMLAVGVVEIVAGLVVAVRPKVGGYLVAAWLAGIITNLLLLGGHYDVALRDFGLLLAALALARLATAFQPTHATPPTATA